MANEDDNESTKNSFRQRKQAQSRATSSLNKNTKLTQNNINYNLVQSMANQFANNKQRKPMATIQFPQRSESPFIN